MDETTKPKCGAKTKSTGEPCQQPAGFGTDHVGEGRCKFHGGATPAKHGLYSMYSSRRLADRLEQMRKAEGELADLADDILLARAVISTQTEQADALDAAKAKELLQLLERLSRIIARQHKIRHGEEYTVTVEEVDQFTEVVKQTIRREFDRARSADELIASIGAALERKVSP
ncbi:MAG: hypothetical protein ACOCV2_15620 [Persicimonas sp.]